MVFDHWYLEKIDILFRVNFKSKSEWENFKRLASLGQRYLLEKSEERFRTKTTKEIGTIQKIKLRKKWALWNYSIIEVYISTSEMAKLDHVYESRRSGA